MTQALTPGFDARRYPQLAEIDFPADLRKLDAAQLPALAGELRACLIDSVARAGGHFAAGLGVVELTVALHWLFDTPHDRLVWDVGHQCYPHKMLTGRRDRIATIKQRGGLAPFPSREESEYDCFGVGHSSTSISAALGMALALRERGDPRKVVAVIGDGAMTAGMAYEALNHAGGIDPALDFLVVLNDNRMSISENVGGLSRLFDRNGARQRAVSPDAADYPRWEDQWAGMFQPSTLFEAMGFAYSGPVDGHDLPALLAALTRAKSQRGPQLMHVVTVKGKGYAPAEQDQIGYHAVGPFDPGVGVQPPAAAAPTYSDVFGDWLCDMAEADRRLVAITPAMREGSGLVRYSKTFPQRYFDVAIGEQHAVTLAAGLACEGAKPVVAIYSTFLQRGYDQLIHDVALQNLDVLFAIDRAGLVGPDGPTHAGAFDLSFLRCIPNLVLMTPSDEQECRALLSTGFAHLGPAAVRYPRGRGPGAALSANLDPLPIGKARTVKSGAGLALLAFGAPLSAAFDVAERFGFTVVDMRFVKPLDTGLIAELAASHHGLVTLEDNVVGGGAGSAVLEWLQASAIAAPVLTLGLPDRFQAHASRDQLLAEAGLDAAGIERAILGRWPGYSAARP
ncbi:MAG: 1-deoxy-D-xylulose-5-phosphate synthase [Xanthomonadaceae bacterium]|nr:1-deoxy-D-xylulose-5-phosphate synthase [Xanthomonadaceae bacterium]